MPAKNGHQVTFASVQSVSANLAQFRDEYSFVMFGHDPFYQGNAVNALGMKPKLIQLEHDELTNKDHWRATQYGHGQIEHP
ncbi:hypothetical protein [Marinobacter sp.]|uniref:hypothetical protein n=1 Tax=Marinobacter sp. TaxID=50741 RepID=UPI003A8FF3BE